ncbi:MAG TPA: transposase [Candidatus Paceibacterota bacterium]|nr:transposase [Candidatus Paceibacterota bacterium]
MTRSIQIAPEEFYHLYNRGVEKRKIFLRNADYDRFLALLYLANQDEPADLKYQGHSLREVQRVRGTQLVDIIAYCLMPNHFHILARERTEGGIARFMQKVTTGYTMYFNKRNERSGALFGGTYKAKHVSEDRYFRYLVAYIHLNPVKLLDPSWKESGIKDSVRAERFLTQYAFSSYPDYSGEERPHGLILERTVLEDLFPSAGDFKSCVTEWLTYGANQDKV